MEEFHNQKKSEMTYKKEAIGPYDYAFPLSFRQPAVTLSLYSFI